MFSFYTVPSFHAPVAAPQSTLTSLFRLLDDFDTYSRRPQHRQPPYQRRQGQTQVFRPRFDACETETSYELHGDLPGVSKEHLDIQFTGPQTLVVKGRVVRQYELDRPEESEPQPEQPAQAAEPQPESTARTEPEPDTESEKKDEFVVVNKHQATVEDDPEEESIGTLSVSSSSPVPTPAESPKTTEVTKPAPAPVSAAETTEKKQDTDKVCVFERIVGEFERTFEFPGRVDQEAVSATLENGVLHISVPKAVTRRIFVN